MARHVWTHVTKSRSLICETHIIISHILREYFHAKNQRYSCISSRDIIDQITLQSNWTRSFWAITCEVRNFSNIDVTQQKKKKKRKKETIVRSFILLYFKENLMTKFYEI